MAVPRVDDLRSALNKGEIVPHFQPVVDLKVRQVSGFEVLARWVHPQDGATLPLDMISLAEAANLIGGITEALVIQTAELARALPAHLRFSINISPVQFCEASFARRFIALTQQAGLSASQLTVEITESALLDNFELALSISEELKSFGIQLALDDFGTGYSSLRHLQALPFDELKIDASFVNSMSDRRESRKIVAAITGLSHSLGLMTVAEGIETKEQAEMLFYLGCNRGQGWLFSRPLPGSEVVSYLSRSSMDAVLPSPPSTAANMIGTTLEVMPAQRLSQLQAIYDGALVGLCFLDRNLRYVSLNKQFTEAHGRPVESYLGRTVAEVIPQFLPEVKPYLQRALEGECISGLEVSRADLVHPDQLKTYLVSYQPVKDEVGDVIGVSCVAVDITERKRAENALRASMDHYWRAAGTSPQIPWTAAPNGDMIDISPRWEILTGLTYEDVIEGRWTDAIHVDDRERAAEWWGRSVRNGTPLDMLFRLHTQEVDPLWIRATAAPRFGPYGKVIRWYGTLEVIHAQQGEDGSTQ